MESVAALLPYCGHVGGHLPRAGCASTFGPVTAVDGVDLDIADGEFFSMLGPSGSGKTTVLRMVAGFEQPDRRARSCSAART